MVISSMATVNVRELKAAQVRQLAPRGLIVWRRNVDSVSCRTSQTAQEVRETSRRFEEAFIEIGDLGVKGI
jgi:hypothetical protein